MVLVFVWSIDLCIFVFAMIIFLFIAVVTANNMLSKNNIHCLCCTFAHFLWCTFLVIDEQLWKVESFGLLACTQEGSVSSNVKIDSFILDILCMQRSFIHCAHRCQ